MRFSSLVSEVQSFKSAQTLTSTGPVHTILLLSIILSSLIHSQSSSLQTSVIPYFSNSSRINIQHIYRYGVSL